MPKQLTDEQKERKAELRRQRRAADQERRVQTAGVDGKHDARGSAGTQAGTRGYVCERGAGGEGEDWCGDGDMTETMTFRCARCLVNWQLTRDTNGRFVDADGKPAAVVCPECGPGAFLEIVEDFV